MSHTDGAKQLREVLTAEIELRDRREGWENPANRGRFVRTVEHLQTVIDDVDAAESSGRYTPTGVAEHAKTKGETLLVEADEDERESQKIRRGIARTREEARAALLAPPPHVDRLVDAMMCGNVLAQLVQLS